MVPLRGFMIRQIGTAGTKDVALFLKLGKVKNVKSYEMFLLMLSFPPLCLVRLRKHLL
jgi:flagellar biosynthetic protein FliP